MERLIWFLGKLTAKETPARASLRLRFYTWPSGSLYRSSVCLEVIRKPYRPVVRNSQKALMDRIGGGTGTLADTSASAGAHPVTASQVPFRLPVQCRWTWRWGSLEGRTGLPAEVSKAPSLSEETDTLSPTDAASSPSFPLTLVSLLVGFRPLPVTFESWSYLRGGCAV